MKPCVHCRSPIDEEASKCRWCGEWQRRRWGLQDTVGLLVFLLIIALLLAWAGWARL